jgi:glutathione synthase/RimK-type ligase-like ATP-grasp enzyme
MKKPVIGILTWRYGKKFAEPGYFRRLIGAGGELGCEVFLFSPEDVRLTGRSVRGFVPLGKAAWQSKHFSWPDVVIDRYRYTPTDAFMRYVSFRKRNLFLFANNRMANKWRVHEALWQNERMRRWLPETMPYSPVHLRRLIRRYPLLYVKPVNGTGGRGIVRVERSGSGYRLLARSKRRVKVTARLNTAASLISWLGSWVKAETHIIQQGLNIALVSDRSIDLRLLIQKNGDGEWSITGSGIRVGGVKSATSNLHGGGRAVPVRPFLLSRFDAQRTEAILQDCHQLAFETAETVESHFGRMIELGLDIGIDVDGRIWLIEVNPKPGREIFKQLGESDLYRQAIQRPLQFALYLARTKE